MKNTIQIIIMLIITAIIIALLVQFSSKSNVEEFSFKGNTITTEPSAKPLEKMNSKADTLRNNLENAVQDAINVDIQKAIADELRRGNN